MNRALVAGLALALFFSGGAAFAQALPGPADAGRLQERVKPIQPPPPEEKMQIPEEHAAPLGAPPKPVNGFILKEVKVEGATALSQKDLSSAYRQYIGTTADLNVLRYIADRITQIYQEKGFLLSKAVVPVQEIKDGRVRIAAVEGYILRVRLEGNASAALNKRDAFRIVKKAIGKITAMRPLHGPTLEKQLLLLSDLAGVKVQSVMEPLPQAEALPGAVGMVVRIDKQKEWSGSIGADNFGSRYTGPTQISANALVTNTILAFDSISINTLVTSSVPEVELFSLGYAAPLNADGTDISLQGGRSLSNPGYILKVADIRSTTSNGSLKLSQKVLRSREKNLAFSATLDYKDIFANTLGTVLYKDRVRALRLAATFDRTDAMGGGGMTSGVVTYSQGLDFLGTRETGSANLSRAGGHSNFGKVEADLSRTQNLGTQWQGYAAAQGQHAFDTLLSSEEFGYGGQDFGRAYDPSELVGDDGIKGAIEVRYNGMQPWGKATFQPFGFYDIGKVWQLNHGNIISMSGASAGIGTKFIIKQGLSGSFTMALPLTRTPGAPPFENGKGPRWLIQLSSYF